MSSNEPSRSSSGDHGAGPTGGRNPQEFRLVVENLDYQLAEMLKPEHRSSYVSVGKRSIRRLMISLEANLDMPFPVPILLTGENTQNAWEIVSKAAELNECDFLGLNIEFYSSPEWNPATIWDKVEEASRVRNLYLLMDHFDRLESIEGLMGQLLIDVKEKAERSSAISRSQNRVQIIATTRLPYEEFEKRFDPSLVHQFYHLCLGIEE